MLIIKTGGDRAPHNTYYVVQWEYMGRENLVGMKFDHLLVLKRDDTGKAYIPTGFVNATAELYVL